MIRALLRRLLPGRGSVIAIPYIWLLLFFLIPFIIVLKISFAQMQIAMPPFTESVYLPGRAAQL